jgi:enoyl-CoA hydratase/carnithine racemase
MELRDLRYDVRDHVATLTLDRPERLNAISAVFLQLLPLFASQDFREGMAAFLERRPARFMGR